WRQMRDFFYAPNMNGMDWKGIRQKYEPLVNHVNHRADLNYIAGEMISELNAGHCYVGNGDLPEVETIKMGLLGAELSKDPESGYFQVDRVLEGANWKKSLRSPLTQSGVEVEEGDYIIAVNGASTDEMPNIYQSLVGKAGKQVELRVNESPKLKNSRKVIVKPIGSEKQLYYYNWVQKNMDKVNEASNGKIGYVHIPDMARNGLNEFVENFYPQLRKKALIVDVRGNGGGNVSPMLIERLRRELAMYTKPRNGEPRPNPSDMIMGPQICLMDEWSASDGDLFPYRSRKHNLGKLVGQRTWGGVVGIRGSLPFVDGGTLHKPEFAKFDSEGKEWIIEGHGVEPDVEVFNDPYQQYQGTDQQLQKAIDMILQQLDDSMPEIPDAPPYPDKSHDG
ncbi:MAG: protease, partial [Bacteroidetes bacterium SW_10_40_5]